MPADQHVINKILAYKDKGYAEKNVDWDATFKLNPSFLEDMSRAIVTTRGSGNTPKNSDAKNIAIYNGLLDSRKTYNCFSEWLNELCDRFSNKEISDSTGYSPQYVSNVRRGHQEAGIEMIINICAVYGIDPKAFPEYRTFMILLSVYRFIEDNPELSMTWVRKVEGA